MKTPKKRTIEILLFTLALTLVYIGFGFLLFGAKSVEKAPRPLETPSVCIYEVVINQLVNLVNIGWTDAPCQDLDIRIPLDHSVLEHSWFNPTCPVFAVQAWPGTYLPVIDYADACDQGMVKPPVERLADEIDDATAN